VNEVKSTIYQIPKFRGISAEQNQAQLDPPFSQPYFKTLGQISEEEKIEILQTGFKLNQEGI
jgi:hypothetical protein